MTHYMFRNNMYINSSLLSYPYYPFLELWYNNKPLLENDMHITHIHTHETTLKQSYQTKNNNNERSLLCIRLWYENNIENNKTQDIIIQYVPATFCTRRHICLQWIFRLLACKIEHEWKTCYVICYVFLQWCIKIFQSYAVIHLDYDIDKHIVNVTLETTMRHDFLLNRRKIACLFDMPFYFNK